MKLKIYFFTGGVVLFVFLIISPVFAEQQNDTRTPFLNPFLEAEHFYYSGDIEKSQHFYQDYLNGKPSYDRGNIALYRLGTIYEQSRSFAIALRYYNLLLDRSPNSLLAQNAKFGQAICFFELEQYILKRQ